MPKKLQLKRPRRMWILLGLGITCLVSVVCLAVPNGGVWVDSGHDDCPQSKVCAEWEISEIEDWAACCIDSNEVGGTNVYACQSIFRHYHGLP